MPRSPCSKPLLTSFEMSRTAVETSLPSRIAKTLPSCAATYNAGSSALVASAVTRGTSTSRRVRTNAVRSESASAPAACGGVGGAGVPGAPVVVVEPAEIVGTVGRSADSSLSHAPSTTIETRTVHIAETREPDVRRPRRTMGRPYTEQPVLLQAGRIRAQMRRLRRRCASTLGP